MRVCVCVFAQKCRSEVLLRSVNQKCCSEVPLGSVDQKCCSEVSIKRASLRGVIKSVAQGYCSLRSEVSLRSVIQKRLSNMCVETSLELSQLCSTSLVREVQVSSSSWKIATMKCKSSTQSTGVQLQFEIVTL